ncbi:MAG: RluA family pseudouridine synthase [Candidatus Marinimicrobia bacterium]|nr:RluA family pseudouridine synthase [Candidatus Neomarinimicrobiota bacterium]
MTFTLAAPPAAAGQRLDVWLAAARPEYSRARWRAWILTDCVRLDGQLRKPSHTLAGGERLEVTLPPPRPATPQPQDLPLAVVYQDRDLLVVNKPPGLVVHPAPGHPDGTLVNALLHHCTDLEAIGGELRPGIVHRLDRDTSGLLVIAKRDPVLRALQAQFQARTVHKEYLALVRGVPAPPTGRVETLIGRHPRQRQRMSTRVTRGRQAVSHYAVEENWRRAARVRVTIETGRTHQVRVHLAALGHPVLGDALYGRVRPEEKELGADRQMLHAARLAFAHPTTNAALDFLAPPPADFLAVESSLRALAARNL